MPMDNPRAYMKKGNPGSAVMVAAKGRMADVLKRMMAAKLKARLGKALDGDEGESAEMEAEESESKENELPEEELKQLFEMYGKLK